MNEYDAITAACDFTALVLGEDMSLFGAPLSHHICSQHALEAAEEYASLLLREDISANPKHALIAPLIRKLARAVRKRLKGGSQQDFTAVYQRIAKRANRAGAALASSQLARIPAIEAPRKKQQSVQHAAIIATLAPRRTALTAMQMVDFGKDDVSFERATMIAEYEVSSLFHDGMAALADALATQSAELVQKQWVVDGDPCEECQANADDGWIDEDALFASGESEPPQHPNCRCSLDYRSR